MTDPTAPLRAPRPFLPPPTPIRDTPFLQEVNHVLPEASPDRVPLVAVLKTPSAFTGWAAPLYILPRGVRASDRPAGTAELLGPADPDLERAAATDGALFLASARKIYRILPDGTTSSTAAPGEISGLYAGKDGAYLIVDRAVWMVPASGPLAAAAADRAAPPTGVLEAEAVLESGDDVWVATSSVVRRYLRGGLNAPVAQWSATLPAARLGRVVAVVPGVRVVAGIDLLVVGERGVAGVSLAGSSAADLPIFARDHVPYDQATGAVGVDGGAVISTHLGAMRLVDRGIGPEWRVYNADRWIPSPDVRGVSLGGAPGELWFATAGGPGHVTAETMTLEQKLGPFVERIVSRHDRDGAVADSHLTTRGDLSTNIPWDSDNDGSWTGYWVRGECYRYKVTGDPAAKAHFDEALEGMLRLRDESGMDWFVARSAIRKAGCKLDDCDNPDDGMWFTSPDGEWWIKADTSNDEVIAHLAMMGVAYDVCADEAQKVRIKNHIVGIVGGIVDHGWQLWDRDLLPTTYGRWDPEYVNDSIPGSIGDGGVQAAEALAGLTLAHYFTGDPKFYNAKRELIEKYHYVENAEKELEYPFRRREMDNDEMANNAWLILLQYEPDEALYQRWVAAVQRNWEHKFKFQQAPWWILIHAGLAGASAPPEDLVRWLRLTPVDMIRWNLLNSNRHDLVPPPYDYFKQEGTGLRSDGRIIPYDERRCDRWNTDQYRLDGGFGGMVEMDGADVLEPYWLARYSGWITAP